MSALTKYEMAERLFEELGLNKREAKEIVELFFEEVRASLEGNEQVLRALRGGDDGLVPDWSVPSVVVARDLTPSETAGLERDLVLGFVTDEGCRFVDSEPIPMPALVRDLGDP